MVKSRNKSENAVLCISSKNIVDTQIEMVNKHMGYTEGSRYLTNSGYAFYYNQLANGMDVSDADRYANLNTILGYDIGRETFQTIDMWVYEHGYDLLDFIGSDDDKEILQQATKETKMEDLDYSKWTNYQDHESEYVYLYFDI